MTSFIRKTALAAAFFTATGGMLGLATAADSLSIGSDAPALNVEHWIQDGNGKFKPVTKFEPGKVYVVEFWATWCGPCVASMPHLAALQNEYAPKGVQIISISDEDLETVEKFLERPVRGSGEEGADAEPQTYRQLTSAYCLTTDPDQSSAEDYMRAAGQNGIPTSFIVGKDSKIEWIGHPMELDGTLAAVVNGSWDREAFAKEFKAQQEAERAMQEIFALLQNEDFDGALKLIDATIAKTDKTELKMLKLQVLLAAKKMEQAVEHLQAMYTSLVDDPASVNMLAWNLYEMAAQGRIESPAMLESSLAAVTKATEKADKEERASLLDTAAHLHFQRGELDKAIELETQALKLAGERDRDFIENFLKELQEAKNPKPAPEGEAPAADDK